MTVARVRGRYMGCKAAEKAEKMGLQSVMNGRALRPRALPMIAILKRLIEAERWGSVVTHDEIAAAIGVGREKHRSEYQAIVNCAAVDVANETGVTIVCVRNVGYQIPTGVNQLRHGNGRVKSASRSLRRAARTIASISDARLDELGRSARDATVSQLAILEATVKSTGKTLSLQLKLKQGTEA